MFFTKTLPTILQTGISYRNFSTYFGYWRGNNLRKSNEELLSLFRNKEAKWLPMNQKLEILSSVGTTIPPFYHLSSQQYFKEPLVLDRNTFFLGTNDKGAPFFAVLPEVVRTLD